jgi:cytochrome c-type biogenesis protein
MSLPDLALALLSGVLSTLSPCVLPLLPIVIASATQAHRWGGLALGLGLTVSFTLLGLFLATVGIEIGLSPSRFRLVAGFMLLLFGLVLLVPYLQKRFTEMASLVAGRGGNLSSRVSGEGWHGQLLVGLLLGAIWTPCVGPTLGAAATLASSGQHLGHAALTMLSFGIGAALPLVLLGSISGQSLNKIRSRLLRSAEGGKRVLGALLLLIGLGIVTGYDRKVESLLVSASPDWLTALTTRF